VATAVAFFFAEGICSSGDNTPFVVSDSSRFRFLEELHRAEELLSSSQAFATRHNMMAFFL